ncbi:hypothetical protein INR49_015128 [Caranx melampygus]|nr:hypothetical protein INR49_015128 [Caranx melampygus]
MLTVDNVMFALSSRDRTNRSTETSILYCYNGTIKEKLDIKNILFCALCSCVGGVVDVGGVVVFSCHSGVGCFSLTDGDNAATSDFFFVLPHPLGKTKQTNRRRLFISHHKWLCLPCTVTTETTDTADNDATPVRAPSPIVRPLLPGTMRPLSPSRAPTSRWTPGTLKTWQTRRRKDCFPRGRNY